MEDTRACIASPDDRLTAQVSPMGAQLMSLALDGREYLWQGDARWWPRRAPVLFPIVGSLRPGTASAQGPCPMGRHGVARSKLFRLVQADPSSATFELESDEETLAAFPHPFRLRMTYALEDDSPAPGANAAPAGGTSAQLRQTFEVTNPGKTPLPFTLGGHPAFNVPLCPGERFEDYVLRFARPWTASSPAMVEDGLWDFGQRVPVLEGADRLPLSHRLFDVDTLLLENVPERRVELVSPQGHGVRVAFDGFPYLGVWSAAGDAPFVALEPWRGCSTATDEDARFESKRHTTVLAPGETDTCSFTVQAF